MFIKRPTTMMSNVALGLKKL